MSLLQVRRERNHYPETGSTRALETRHSALIALIAATTDASVRHSGVKSRFQRLVMHSFPGTRPYPLLPYLCPRASSKKRTLKRDKPTATLGSCGDACDSPLALLAAAATTAATTAANTLKALNARRTRTRCWRRRCGAGTSGFVARHFERRRQ